MGHTLKIIWMLLVGILLLSCSNDKGQRNPFLPEVGFRFDVDLNLPLYNPLINPGNPVYVSSGGVGIRGVIIMNTGFDVFRAFEATCPNHSPSSCSTMQIEGQVAVCSCEDFEYSLFTGQQLNRPDDGMRYYDMLEYNARTSGSVITVTN
ncbi:MAG: hypothetical protein HKN89_08695 [Eudoraea sp.]|nr:hypothetical protein [Eudoraea sp.]